MKDCETAMLLGSIVEAFSKLLWHSLINNASGVYISISDQRAQLYTCMAKDHFKALLRSEHAQ